MCTAIGEKQSIALQLGRVKYSVRFFSLLNYTVIAAVRISNRSSLRGFLVCFVGFAWDFFAWVPLRFILGSFVSLREFLLAIVENLFQPFSCLPPSTRFLQAPDSFAFLWQAVILIFREHTAGFVTHSSQLPIWSSHTNFY